MATAFPKLARSVLAALVAASLSTSCSGSDSEKPLPLKQVADIPLPGRTTRWDYTSLDPNRHHLFIAHLGDGVIPVFDTVREQVVANIDGVDSVHGTLYVPELGRVYASATGTNEVVAIDADSLKIVARTPGGDYPDGMAYAPDTHTLFVSDEHGGTETVIDTRSNQRIATIPLGGEVGNTQYDPASKHIFVNEQKHGQLVEIDPAMNKVVARIDLPGADGNHGLYIDAADRLAFIACEDNHKLLVLDMASRHVAASFDVGDGPDVLAFDAGLGLLYVASESGTVSMFKVKDRVVTELGRAKLGPNAHVVAVDTATHQAYFPLENVDGRSVLRITTSVTGQ